MSEKNLKSKLLVLIDANALLHRAFYALPPLTTEKGELVNAVYGFLSVLLKVFNELKPDYVLCAWDKKAPTFRHRIYKEYKATRQKAPIELYKQIPRIKQVLKAFNIPLYEVNGYEADDIIGTLSKKAKINNIIVTGDLDALQLIDEDTKVYTLRKGVQDTIIYDEKETEKRFGIKPKQLIDFKALKGDPSDNIPGVAGIGEKTAINLIKEFGNIENLYQNINSPKIRDRYRKLLKEQKSKAFLSKKLAKIVCDIPLKIDWKKAKLKTYNRDKVVKLFQELEFKSLIKRLPKTSKPEQINLFEKKESKKYKFVKSKKEFNNFLNKLNKVKTFVFYLEKKGMSFVFPEEIYYLSSDYLDKLKPIFENKKIEKYGYDLKKSRLVLAEKKINLTNAKFDIKIASYLLNPTGNFDLEDIIFRELGREIPKLEERKLVCFKADLVSQLKERLEKKLKRNKKIYQLFQEIEMPLIEVLSQMETVGIKIDLPYFKKLSQDFKKSINVLEKEIYRLAGTKFNLSSPKQLSKILFTKLKLPTEEIKKTTTGYSTGAGELFKLRKKHPIIILIEQYRELAKLKTTYIDTLPKLANSNNRVHTTFNQTGTVTGRLSSSNPNLQNIPVKTEMGRKIRKAFIAEKGYKFLSADYSQIDLRILAHLSQDNQMLEAFKKNEDIHTQTASQIFGIERKKITPEMRRVAKTINFGIVYGMSPFGLSQRLDIETEKAKNYIDKYFEKHIGIAIYIKKTIEEARKRGYVETLFGRRRYLPGLNSESLQVRASAERMAINMPIQGTTADIIKIAMNKIYSQLVIGNPKLRILVQIHDELLFEIKEDEIINYSQKIKEIMENVYQLKIPLKVDLKVGNNWQEMKAI